MCLAASYVNNEQVPSGPRIYRQEKATRLCVRITILGWFGSTSKLHVPANVVSAEASSQVKYSGSDMKPLRHLKRRPPAALPAALCAALLLELLRARGCACAGRDARREVPQRSPGSFRSAALVRARRAPRGAAQALQSAETRKPQTLCSAWHLPCVKAPKTGNQCRRRTNQDDARRLPFHDSCLASADRSSRSAS